MAISRKTVTGTGNSSVNTTGYSHAIISVVSGDRLITVNCGGTIRDISGVKNRLVIPPGVTTLNITNAGADSWKVELQNSTPALNQEELHIAYNEAGKAVVYGDDDISFVGEPTTNSANISGIQPNAENLATLFQKAIVTKAVADAAKYCKLKAAFLTRYGV